MAETPDPIRRKSPEDLEAAGFSLTPRHFVRLSSAFAILLSTVAITYNFTERVIFGPLQQTNAALRENIKTEEDTIARLQRENTNLTHNYEAALGKAGRAQLTSPKDEAQLVGDQVEFSWDIPPNSIALGYILELRNLRTNTPSVRNVLRPDLRLMDISIPPGQSGTYLWRVGPGRVMANRNGETQIVTEGQWSEYNTFSIYPSVEERIRRTGVIRIAISPSSTGKFNFLNERGDLVGLDRDLMTWLAAELGMRLHTERPIVVSTSEKPWTGLLPSLESKEVDALISSMTSTRPREQQYKVTFTDGYFRTHQIFVAKRRTVVHKYFAGMTLGVVKGTTNEQVAEFLVERPGTLIGARPYQFRIDNRFINYDNAYQALIDDDVDLLLVDDVNADAQIREGTVSQIGVSLDRELLPFYKHVFGRSEECYAIGVKDPELLAVINELLRGEHGRNELAALQKKWFGSLSSSRSCDGGDASANNH